MSCSGQCGFCPISQSLLERRSRKAVVDLTLSCLSFQDDRPLAYDGSSPASGFGDIGCSSDIFSLVLVPPSLSSRTRVFSLTNDSKLRIMSSSSKRDRPSPPAVEKEWGDPHDLFLARTLAIAFL